MEITTEIITHARKDALKCLHHELNGIPDWIYEEAIQQASLELWRRRDEISFDHEKQIVSWLVTTAERHAWKLLDQNKRKLPLEAAASNGEDDYGVEAFERKNLLTAYSSKLPKKKSDVVKLYIEGYSISVIAETLGEKPDTIQKRLASAKKTMQIWWENDTKKKF